MMDLYVNGCHIRMAEAPNAKSSLESLGNNNEKLFRLQISEIPAHASS